jgi:hypothetical protein
MTGKERPAAPKSERKWVTKAWKAEEERKRALWELWQQAPQEASQGLQELTDMAMASTLVASG